MLVDLPPERPQVVQPRPSTPGALAVFEAACVSGTATLNSQDVRAVNLEQLPSQAREILRFALPLEPGNVPGRRAVGRNESPRQIYRLTQLSEAYLLLPGTGNTTAFSNVCAVIIRGDWFKDALRANFGREAEEPVGIGGVVAFPYLSVTANGYRRTAAKYAGWTIAATVPDAGLIGGSK